jgi:hypothetical protein
MMTLFCYYCCRLSLLIMTFAAALLLLLLLLLAAAVDHGTRVSRLQAFSPVHVNSAWMAVGAYPATRADVENPQVRKGANDEFTMRKLDDNEVKARRLMAVLEERELAQVVRDAGLWEWIAEHSDTWKRADGSREWKLQEVSIKVRASASTGAFCFFVPSTCLSELPHAIRFFCVTFFCVSSSLLFAFVDMNRRSHGRLRSRTLAMWNVMCLLVQGGSGCGRVRFAPMGASFSTASSGRSTALPTCRSRMRTRLRRSCV